MSAASPKEASIFHIPSYHTLKKGEQSLLNHPLPRGVINN